MNTQLIEQPEDKRGTFLLIAGGILMVGIIIVFVLITGDKEGGEQKGARLESYGTVPTDVTFTTQAGTTMRLGDLRGAPWVASFIFTRCQGICPVMTQSLGVLQSDLDPESQVKLVSFTVDPDYDTPEQLTKYAREYEADTQRWIFLRAGDSVVQNLAQNAFHVAIAEGTDPNEPIVHSSKFFVVDAKGEVRGIFDGRNREGREELLDLLQVLESDEKE